MESGEITAGTLLIASPTLRDPNFARTVVLLCEHTDTGSMGLVVNRPTTTSVADVLRGVSQLPPAEEILYRGGPVQQDILLVLHKLDVIVPGAQPVAAGMALGGDMQALVDVLAGTRGPSDRIRVYAGYAGWGEGQLEMEMATGSWFICPATAEIVFDLDPEEAWNAAIRGLGPDYEHLVTMPLDPRVN